MQEDQLEFWASLVYTVKELPENTPKPNKTTKGSHTSSALCQPSDFLSLSNNFLICTSSSPPEVYVHLVQLAGCLVHTQ